MKKYLYILLAIFITLPFAGFAQEWDDIYADPSVKSKKERQINNRQRTRNEQQKYVVIKGDRDMRVEISDSELDRYNRRVASSADSTKISQSGGDYEYTDRIIRFHDPQSSVKVTGAKEVSVYVDNGVYNNYYRNRGYDYNVNVGWGGYYSPWYDDCYSWGWGSRYNRGYYGYYGYAPRYYNSWYGGGWYNDPWYYPSYSYGWGGHSAWAYHQGYNDGWYDGHYGNYYGGYYPSAQVRQRRPYSGNGTFRTEKDNSAYWGYSNNNRNQSARAPRSGNGTYRGYNDNSAYVDSNNSNNARVYNRSSNNNYRSYKENSSYRDNNNNRSVVVNPNNNVNRSNQGNYRSYKENSSYKSNSNSTNRSSESNRNSTWSTNDNSRSSSSSGNSNRSSTPTRTRGSGRL